MNKPSDAQQKAITHLSGPAQIIAGPGSGKTFTIIHRILYLIEHYHVRPDKILVITYTKAAANEMKNRLKESKEASGIWLGTFHSVCYNILKKSGRIPANSLIKEGDKRKLLQIVSGNQGLAAKCNYEAITLLENMISYIKNVPDHSLTKQMQSDSSFSVEEVIAVKEEYDRQLREQGMIDFDDMISECLKLLTERRDILEQYREMFTYILVDEFQDINTLQYQILKLLAHPINNLFIVGDDDQAIYGFRGSTPGIMKQFMDDFPNGHQIMLTENYRSGQEIISLADQMISRNKERFHKQFHPVRRGGRIVTSCFDTRKEEERQLLLELSAQDAESLCHTALLLRTNMEAVQYAELLRNAGIAINELKKSTEDIFHSFIMEDISAFLSYIYFGNQRSDLICFMNKPNRFFSRMALPVERVMPAHMETYYKNNPSMCMEVKKFFAQLQIAGRLRPPLAISFFRKTLRYDQYLQEKAKDISVFKRWQRNLEAIQKSFENYEIGKRPEEFIELQTEKAAAAVSIPEKQEGVSILTMHGAKGLEFTRVYLPDLNEGIIPSRNTQTPQELEEERRLLYVAITRAQNELFIYYTKERGRKLSRYLDDIILPP